MELDLALTSTVAVVAEGGTAVIQLETFYLQTLAVTTSAPPLRAFLSLPHRRVCNLILISSVFALTRALAKHAHRGQNARSASNTYSVSFFVFRSIPSCHYNAMPLNIEREYQYTLSVSARAWINRFKQAATPAPPISRTAHQRYSAKGLLWQLHRAWPTLIPSGKRA